MMMHGLANSKFVIVSRSVLLRMRNVSDKILEKIKGAILHLYLHFTFIFTFYIYIYILHLYLHFLIVSFMR